MIPALLAVPVVQGIVGGMVNGVMNAFTPSTPPPGSAAASFNPYLSQATAAVAPSAAPVASSTGSMRSDEWGQMDPTDMKSWASSLTGKHVVATDEGGRTISGTVSGMQQLGNTLALNVGGHLVSLSQLKQISWSPSIA